MDIRDILVFSVFGLLKLSIFFEILVFCFNKYRYDQCNCVSMEINTCAKNVHIDLPVPIRSTTCYKYW